MISLESRLQAVMKSEVLVQSSKDGKVILRERKAKMSVEVTSDRTRVVTLNMSKIGHLRAICEHSGLKRVCDYFLVSRIDGTWHAVLVELKKTLDSSGNFREQLRRSLPIVKYLVSVVEVEYEQEVTELEISYASIFERIGRRFDKQYLKCPNQNLGESEDWKSIKIRRFLGSRLYLRDLVSAVNPAVND